MLARLERDSISFSDDLSACLNYAYTICDSRRILAVYMHCICLLSASSRVIYIGQYEQNRQLWRQLPKLTKRNRKENK